MRPRIVIGLHLLIYFFISSLSLASVERHTADLKLQFPHGLLSDDHGILNSDDLAINACEVRPRPFDINSRYYPYEYWQCFKSKNFSLNCDSNGTRDKYEGVMGLIVVKISNHDIHHEFIAPRLWPIKDCQRFLKDAAALLKGTDHACISASFIEKEKDRSGHPSSSWLFGRIKTKNGCEGRDCDFTKKFKQDNCPSLKL
jgi:hypothetical protein